MEPQGSLTYSEVSTTRPYLESLESGPHPHTLYIYICTSSALQIRMTFMMKSIID